MKKMQYKTFGKTLIYISIINIIISLFVFIYYKFIKKKYKIKIYDILLVLMIIFAFISLIFAAAIAIGMTACSNADVNSADNIAKSDKSGIKTSYVQTDKEGAKLSSFLTPLESSLAYQRKTMLFDDLSNAEHRVAIGMITYPREEMILKYEDW
jgi:hypothetical protein